MNIGTIIKIIITIIILLAFRACSKSEFLDKKPQKSLLVPSTIEHLQALLDMDGIMNGLDGQGLTPHIGESASDNVYVTDTDFRASMPSQMQNYYTWNESPYIGTRVLDWEYAYRAILSTNVVLAKIPEVQVSEFQNDLKQYLSAQAYFHQAHQYYQLAQIFMTAYDKSKAAQLSGLPIRVEDDINERLTVSSMEETYAFILERLKMSIPNLPTTNVYTHRPSKQAAYALLARVYLQMGEYQYAKDYADSCLHIQGDLYDYNLISPSWGPFAKVGGILHPVHKEVIFNCNMLSDPYQGYSTSYLFGLVDSNLYAQYEDNDLRKVVFFEKLTNGHRFVGSYAEQPAIHFSGLAVDEIYLIRAECHIRLQKSDKCLEDLNFLRMHRYKKGTYEPLPLMSTEELLNEVLMERRKQLLYRGIRWADLKRLSIMGHETPLSRVIDGSVYKPTSNLANFMWEFPPEVHVN